ncbi:calmodulin-like protein 1 [Gouania willdenowi]|uniref:calmodulin-like protein 1 n=1 Tax=Gouania willdenowi TaxID=441366 RepID=UPI0010561D5E|nr:calmodulin-like protein 1 [Gouania willdenowi]
MASSQDDQDQLRALFHAYDVDHSGSIEKQEFSIICKELRVSPQEAEKIFNRLDVDRDGTVTLEEFIKGFRGQNSEEIEDQDQDQLRALFHAYDMDHSGTIERNEFFIICKELRVPSREAEKIFNQLDVDNDGTVTLEEFIRGFRAQNSEKKDEDDGDRAICR